MNNLIKVITPNKITLARIPYADVLQHLTYFVFFFYKGITPYYFFVIFIYREISIGFVRNLIIQFNIVQQANFLGKLKSILYAVCTFASLLFYTLNQLNFIEPMQNFISYILNFEFKFLFIVHAAYVCAAFFAILSFLDYVLIFLNVKKYENK
nr:CDP-diacylglycerol--glycerol-3-phosphate 3-phosphatidyltransferase [Borreliella garinii]